MTTKANLVIDQGTTLHKYSINLGEMYGGTNNSNRI